MKLLDFVLSILLLSFIILAWREPAKTAAGLGNFLGDVLQHARGSN